MMKEIEASTLRYKELQKRGLSERAANQLEDLDETWLGNMLLVYQELSSGYLFLKLRSKEETPKAGRGRSNRPLKNLNSNKDFTIYLSSSCKM